MNRTNGKEIGNGRGPATKNTDRQDRAAGASGRLSRNVEALCQIIAGIILRVMAEEEARRQAEAGQDLMT